MVHERDAIGHLASKSHLVGHTDHGHAGAGQFYHDLENLVDHFRIKRRSGLIKEHDPGVHAQGTGNRDPLLLAA